MINRTKIIFLSFVTTFFITGVSLATSETKSENCLSDSKCKTSVAEVAVDSKTDTPELKAFIILIKDFFDKYKQDTETLSKKLEDLNSKYSIQIIKSCNGSKVIELSRFKSKNAELLKKLGYVFLSILTEAITTVLPTLNFSQKETNEIELIINDLSEFIAQKLAKITPSSNGKTKENKKNIKRITKKIDPVLDTIFEKLIPLNAETLVSIKQKLSESIEKLLTRGEVSELCKFVTKQNGAFDKISADIETIWNLLCDGLK